MKTYIAEIIPKLERFSQKLDNLTLLTNQHWVLFDDQNVEKVVYIFRSNNQLLIARSGKVEKGKWETIGNSSILIDIEKESYLFKHGFFDRDVLALKLDGKNEYVFLINENRYTGNLDSYEKIIDFLDLNYLGKPLPFKFKTQEKADSPKRRVKRAELTEIETHKGLIYIEGYKENMNGKEVFINRSGQEPATDGKYKIGFMWYVYVKNGRVTRTTIF